MVNYFTMLARKKAKLTHKFCPHCGKQCNIKTYKEHKRLYFCRDTKKWHDTSTRPPLPSKPTHPEPESDSEGVPSSVESENERMVLSDDDDSPSSLGLGSAVNSDQNDTVTEYWMESDDEIDEDLDDALSVPASPPHMHCNLPTAASSEDKESESLVWWIVTFVSIFQTVHAIPDRAITWLLKFIAVLLNFCSRYSEMLKKAVKLFPKTLFLKNKFLTKFKGQDSVNKYVVCLQCHSLYSHQDCYEKRGSRFILKKCSQTIFSKLCNTDLLKRVILKSGSTKLYPFKIYSYTSLISGIQKLLLRPGFTEMCESTRNYFESSDSFSDVFQGNIWKEFLKVSGQDFLCSAFCYGLLMNIDWFQPFEHITYSVGVIYLVLMNLPRRDRYKRQNVIIVGIIPGPSEPSLLINSYLGPLVTELIQLWKGVKLDVYNSAGVKVSVRAALLGVACDIPAGRKVSGFLGHSANLGCPRCYCEFSEGGTKRNYSNFNRSTWILRNNSKHRRDVNSLITKSSSMSATAVSKMESELGCRYSALLELSYFDPVRMTIIDGMHNLFLGSAKHFTKDLLIKTGLLTKEAINTVHKRIKNVQLPVGMGRLPLQIDSGSTFTAEQWMNWTLYYSVYCLHGLICNDHMECWRHFVLACRILCKQSISERDITVADLLLVQFCRRTSRCFGLSSLNPNMHLHCHLRECLRDYGPLHAFWLFSFERYNGLLGNLPTNNRSIELQLLKRFLRDGNHLELINSTKTELFQEEFYDAVCGHAKKIHSLTESTDIEESTQIYKLPGKYVLQSFDEALLPYLREVYAHLHPECTDYFLSEMNTIPSTYKRYNFIQLFQNKMSSVSDKHEGRVTHCLAKPIPARTYATSDSTPSLDPRPIEIQYFAEHSWVISLSDECNSSKQYSHIFAVCEWPQPHPNRHIMGKPVEIWCHKLFEYEKFNCFIPLENITSRTIVAIDKVCGEDVLVIVPLVNKLK